MSHCTDFFVLNDTHLGVKRSNGTTPETSKALQEALFFDFVSTLQANKDKTLIHAGDLFDKFEVDNRTWMMTYAALSSWFSESEQHAFFIQGNHDSNPRGEKVSSWNMLVGSLALSFPHQVHIIEGSLTSINEHIWAIGHCANQDLFDAELKKALELPSNSTLILHCNYNNHFAQESDHSLNLSEEVAKQLKANEIQILAGHEHQASQHLQGAVKMFGNQFPTSIADCLGNDKKYYHCLSETGEVSKQESYDVDQHFKRVQWEDLALLEDNYKYVRVEGDIKQEQAEHVLGAIANYRKLSKAFVVTNAVKIEGIPSLDEDVTISLDDIKGFDVLEKLLESLEDQERQVIQGLLENQRD